MQLKINKYEYQRSIKLGRVIKFKNKIVNIFSRFMVIPGFRVWLYRMMGIKISKEVFIGMDCFLDDEVPKLITIEQGVTIAFRVTIVAHDDTGEKTVSPILIKKGAYIGTGAIILPGVTIGENSIIAAGAVVNKDVEDNIISGGVPSVKIKHIGK